jgi:phosphoribosylformimino-5-aminoimidazole carboxamide ribonucleotide (ProFAR) isomerase
MFEIVPAVDLKAGRCVRLVQGRALYSGAVDLAAAVAEVQ